jgi:cell division GTPase FtsZ
MGIVRKNGILNNHSNRNNMSVKNETIKNEQPELVDDIQNEEIKNTMNEEENLDNSVMEVLKAKMMAKKTEETKTVKESAREVTEDKKMTVKIVEKKKKSISFGIIGSGQAGGRICDSFHELGYSGLVFNTAHQDMAELSLPEEDRVFLEYTIGGAGKLTDVGQAACEANIDLIRSKIVDKFSDAQSIIFCSSLGGGSGAGSVPIMIPLINECLSIPIIVLAVLPLSSDDGQSKNNSVQTLSKLATMVQNKQIANLIIIDNSRIETIFADVSQMDFFSVANTAVVAPIDAFNKFSSMSSKVKSLDPMEFASLILQGHGLSIYGELNVGHDVVQEPTAIAEAIIESLSGSLLSSGFDLKQASYVGVLFIGNPKVMQSIPSANINYAMSLIKETSPSATAVFKGVYEDPEMTEQDGLKIYSFFAGLGLPDLKIQTLRAQAKEELDKVQGRDQNRNLTLKLDLGDESTNMAQKVKDMIKKNSSNFNKTFVGIKDFRKK